MKFIAFKIYNKGFIMIPKDKAYISDDNHRSGVLVTFEETKILARARNLIKVR